MNTQLTHIELINKESITYLLLSITGIYTVFTGVKNLLKSHNVTSHFYAIVLSLILPTFHLHVFHSGEIPFFNIKLSDNIILYYISFWLSLISLAPYLIARRLYSR